MIDLHTHSIFIDGALLPYELARRCEFLGFEGLSITDHVDRSNLDHVVPRIVAVCKELNTYMKIKVIPGVEITHVPPEAISRLAEEARNLGALIVIVHGETLSEPVVPGTNRAALNTPIDILAHPGLISEEDAGLAAKKGIFLELSGRKGHSLANGHVAAIAKKTGAPLLFNSDAHEPGDLIEFEKAKSILQGTALSEDESLLILNNSKKLMESLNL